MSAIEVKLPSLMTAKWTEGRFGRPAQIALYFGEFVIGMVPIPDDYDRTYPLSQGAVDIIVARYLREKLFPTKREDI